MPFIEILTDLKSCNKLDKILFRSMLKNRYILYIKEKNLNNIKNLRLETLVLDRIVVNKDNLNNIIKNSKYFIINKDFYIKDLENIKNMIGANKKIITYGYNSKSDITVSSIEENQIILYVQNILVSIYNKKIEPQEIKINLKSDISVYNIMLIVALTSLYA